MRLLPLVLVCALPLLGGCVVTHAVDAAGNVAATGVGAAGSVATGVVETPGKVLSGGR